MSAPAPSSSSWSAVARTAVPPSPRESALRAGAAAPAHARGPVWPRIASLAVDLLLVCANGALIFYLRFLSGGRGGEVPIGHYLGFLALYAALVGIFCQNRGLYRTTHRLGPLDESFSALMAVFWATLLLTAFIYLSGDKSISRLVVGFSGLLNALTLPAWRFWKSEIVKHRVISGRDGRNVLIVGAGDVGQALAKHFEQNKYLGYVVKGFLDRNGNGNPAILGEPRDLPKLAMAHFVDEVFVTNPSERDLVAQVVLEARQQRFDVKVVPEMFDGLGWRAPIRYIGDFPVMELLREPIPAFGLFVKRLIDFLGAAVGLVVLSPVLALVAIAIRLDSPGPAVYPSWRVGLKGRKFRCCKLRTMVANADEVKDDLRHRNERDGPFFKITNDPRVTRLGGFLRRYSLDELPQLWNVLKGEMSLVGPRPHPLDDYERYQLEHLRRLDVKPGITGLWQVYGRQDPSFEKALSLDLEYIENWTLWLDVKTLLKTLPAALSGSGA
jgi:exopolysaccharide biosynthesis polyprenyl glycosylphosphotransferase